MIEAFQMAASELLPGLDESDPCLMRLVATLRCHEGVREVHLEPETDERALRFCMHHDPDVITAAEVAEMARELCGSLREHFGHVAYRVRAQRRAYVVAERLRRVTGVASVRVVNQGLLHIEYNHAITSERHLRRDTELTAGRLVSTADC